MKKPSSPLWKTLSVWTRFSLFWSKSPNFRPYFLEVFRLLSLLQTLFLILQNLKYQQLEQLNLFNTLSDGVNSVLILEFSLSYWTHLILVTSYFSFVFLLVIFTFYFIRKDSRHQFWKYSRSFGLLTTFHAEVLFYPLNRSLCELLKNSNDNEFDLTKKAVTISLVSVLIFFNVAVTYFKIVFCYSRINSKKFISRKSSLHLIGITTIKLFLPFLQYFIIQSKHEEESIIYKVVTAIIYLFIFFGFLIYTLLVFPEYSLVLMKMHIAFGGMYVGIYISQIIAIIAKEENSFINLNLMMIPLWIKLSLNIFHVILNQTKHFSQRITNINHLVHLEIIYRHLESKIGKEHRSKKFQVSFFYANWLSNYEFKKFYSLREHKHEIRGFRKESKIYLKGLFEKVLTRNPKSILGSLAYAKLITNHFKLYSKAYLLCCQAFRQSKSIPDQISIYYLINKIEKTIEKDAFTEDIRKASIHLLSQSLKYDTQSEDIKFQLSKYIDESASFWQILREDKPNISNLFKEAKILEQKRLNIELTWGRYESEFSGHVSVITLLYGVIKSHIMNLPWEGGHYIKKYMSSIQNTNFNSMNKADLTNAHGTIMISGEKKNLGEVIYCSEIISEIFSIDTKSLIGQKVNLIMPKFFQEKHHEFLLNNLELGENRRLGKKSFLYGKDSKHNVFPLSITLDMQLDFDKGIVFAALIKRIKDQNEYILFREDNTIEELSDGIRKITGIEPYKKVNINSIFIDFNFDDYKQFSDNQNEVYIPNKIQKFVHLKKQYEAQLVKSSANEANMEGVVQVGLEINRNYYCGEYLNVMILRFNEENRKKIKELLASCNSIKNDKTNYESTSNGGLIKVISKSSRKIKNNETILKNTEFISPRELWSDKNKLVNYENFSIHSDCDNIEDNKVMQRGLGFFGDENVKCSYFCENQLADDFQKIISQPRHNRSKIIIVNLFIVILATFLSLIAVQYIVLRESIGDISFAINAIRTSYERLTSLGLIWWFGLSYRARVFGIVPTIESDLNRFKLRLRTKRDDIKISNAKLMEIIAASEKDQQEKFFTKNIRLVYSNISTSVLDQRKVDTFEAVNIFIEKLTKFDATPHNVLFQNGNPELEFVLQNLMNDLLVSSEDLVENVQNIFTLQIQAKIYQMSLIFFFNLLFGLVTVFIAIIVFYVNHQGDKNLINAITSIHTQTIDFIIYKLMSIRDSMKKNRGILSQSLYNLHQHYSLPKDSLRNFKLVRKDYQSKGPVVNRIKQLLVLVVLICLISLASSIRHISSSALLQEVMKTENQIIFASKVRYNYILGFATLVSMLDSVNETMRNQPMGKQLLLNLDEIPSSNIMFEQFTDDSGQFIDPLIQALLEEKPCSYVINYPGSQNDVNCPKATQDQSIGLLAVYSYFLEELYGFSRQILADPSIQNGIRIFNLLPLSSPKMTTINGGFMFLIDFLSEKIDRKVSILLEDAKMKLILQIIIMLVLSLIVIWFIIKKLFDDSTTRAILKMIPFEEILKNKFLKTYIKEYYKKQIKLLDQDI